MTNRQRLKTFLVTSALIGGFCLPAMAGELTPAQAGTDTAAPAAQPAPATQLAPAPQASQPAAEAPKGMRVTRVPHRIAHAAPRVTPHVFQPAPIEVASSESAASRTSRVVAMMWGVAY